jgi:tetratricopeptide (TPR) repeat protein
MIKSRYLYVILAVLAIASCSDDFVDVDPQFENSADFFNSEEDYQDALIGAYDLLQTTYINVMLGEIASDNTLSGGESATDAIGIQEIDEMTHTPLNQQLRDIWGWMYSGVNRANFIMQYENKTPFPGKENVIAQTRFLRAYYYFELVKFFGDVPLIRDRVVEFGDERDIPKAPKEDVYALIEEDLIWAADNLPLTQSQEGRITKGAAQALLGKAYLYQEKWQDAADVLEEVINSGVYLLLEDYSTMFENDNENNIESVFEVQYTDEEGAGFDCLQCSEGNVAVGFNGIRNYNGPLFDSGFSFNVPTQDVVDAFEEGDNRLETAILDIDAWSEETGATFSTGYKHTGYYNRKYIARKGDANIGDANLTNPNNYRAIRYADVLLMAAEALAEVGNDSQALIYLNQVRERAFGNSDNNLSVGGTLLKNAIQQERRVELVGEGHRFFDLVRTGTAANAIDGFQVGKHEVFPIPRIEIELAGNIWEQNPGY